MKRIIFCLWLITLITSFAAITSLYFMHDTPPQPVIEPSTPWVHTAVVNHSLQNIPAWERALGEHLPGGITLGSPACVNVDDDQVLDVVVTMGHVLYGGRVVALAGATGHVLWQHRLPTFVYATPVVIEPLHLLVVGTHRNVRRRANLPAVHDFASDVVALATKSGALSWRLRASNPNRVIPDLNFGTVTVCGQHLYVLCSGGFDDSEKLHLGRRWDDAMRPAAILFVVDVATGIILAQEIPQPREAYGLIVPLPNGDILLGSGGETIPGPLFRLLGQAPYTEQWHTRLLNTKGWIASPALAPGGDIIACSFDATVVRLNGLDGSVRWQRSFPGLEMHASPAMGHFDGDTVLDVVVIGNLGIYPRYVDLSSVFWLNGRDGSVIRRKDVGKFTVSSPLVADLNADGQDETVIVANYKPSLDMPLTASAMGGPSILLVIDGRSNQVLFNFTLPAVSFSTPIMGDFDADGHWSLFHISAVATVYHIQLPYLVQHVGWDTLSWLQYPPAYSARSASR